MNYAKYKFSIIIPLYNIDHEIFRECLNSIYGQTFQNFELIVINDGSNNNCEKVLNEYHRSDIHLILISQSNMGVSYSRNIGITNASGEYILFVDPDDWLEKKALELIDEYTYEKADIIVFHRYLDDYKINNEYYIKDIKYVNSKLIEKFELGLLDENKWMKIDWGQFDYFGAVWDKCYKTEFIKKNRIEFINKLTHCEDTIFNLYCLEECNYLIYTNKMLYHYRKLPTSAMNGYKRDIISKLCELNNEIDKFIKIYRKDDKRFIDASLLKKYSSFQRVMCSYIFHNKNRSKYKEKRHMFKEVLKSNFREVFNSIDINLLNRKGKIVVFACKHELFFLIYIIYKLKNTL